MNEELMIKLANVDTVEELNAILAENGITLEEGVTPEAFLAELKSGSDELNADDLDDVAGGVILPWATMQLIKAMGITVAKYLSKYRHHL